MTPAQPTCETCRYWHRFGSFGTCRRFPPTRIDPDAAYAKDMGDPNGQWPRTDPTDHCGEWKPQPAAL